jgi:hypothetical protein
MRGRWRLERLLTVSSGVSRPRNVQIGADVRLAGWGTRDSFPQSDRTDNGPACTTMVKDNIGQTCRCSLELKELAVRATRVLTRVCGILDNSRPYVAGVSKRLRREDIKRRRI